MSSCGIVTPKERIVSPKGEVVSVSLANIDIGVLISNCVHKYTSTRHVM